MLSTAPPSNEDRRRPDKYADKANPHHLSGASPVASPSFAGGMGNASPTPQADVPAPPLHGGMRNASPALQAASPAPPLQGGMGDASPVLPFDLPASPLQGGWGMPLRY